KDGFSAIVLGFTGKQAIKFRWDFIEAFNKMEHIMRSGIELRVSAVEENIKRRYLLVREMQDVNSQITLMMKRHDTIKKELRAIDTEDFQQLSLFPKYEENTIKNLFPNKIKILKIA
ncbi:MAG: Rha family transcriptional regulator, partial [Prevotellaceae bacterium]|nr:Rha family transcriptional regulator [Prevotellaceae bacterium]